MTRPDAPANDAPIGPVNPWIIAVAVTIATFMEVLDTSIANVALRYIAGGLSAAESDSEWVITSYLAANASVLLLSGWLSAYFGRRNYYLASLLIFTVSSAACGFSRSLPELIFFRILQGLGGGGLQPVTQAVLVDIFPREKQGAAQRLRHLGAGRAGARTDARRLHRRQLFVGMDLLHQHAAGPARAGRQLRRAPRPGLPQGRAGRDAQQTAPLRLHRPRADRAVDGLHGRSC